MIFLDANVVVDLLNGRRPKVRERHSEARRAGTLLALSSVVLFDLRFSIANIQHVERNIRALDALIADGFGIVDFDAEDAADAGTLRAELRRAGCKIGPYDLLSAAQARRRDAPLITGDAKEFARVPRLITLDWTA